MKTPTRIGKITNVDFEGAPDGSRSKQVIQEMENFMNKVEDCPVFLTVFLPGGGGMTVTNKMVGKRNKAGTPMYLIVLDKFSDHFKSDFKRDSSKK